jgi:protein TonB
MNAASWVFDPDQDHELHIGRWAAAILFVLGAHAVLVAAYLYVAPQSGITGADVPVVMVEFAPEAAAPESEADLAPGPETFDSQATQQPQIQQQAAEEPVIDLPPVPAPDPDIVIPPKQEVVEEKKEDAPQPTQQTTVEQPSAQQVESVRQLTSNPKTEKRAEKAVAPRAGTTAARQAMVNYASTLSAHLQRFKRPAKGRGTVVVTFTVNRSGKVVASSITKSSGSPAVDAEALAMIERAQPMPSFPPAITQSEEIFVQAIRFR